jgi:uncharacterized protein (DUF342 family)
MGSDEYNAYMTVTPDPAINLSLTELGPLLKEHGVVFGIKKDVLLTIVGRYRNGSSIDGILAAEGIRPFAGVEPAVEYKFEISSEPGDMAVDVEKGQLLAVKRKLKPPVDGITVTGKQTTFPPIRDIEVRTGQNIEKEEQEDFIYYRAAADGRLTFENKIMSIFPVLEIENNVDSNVGNIHFKGDVKIGGDVMPDFTVEAEGRITIGGSAIACKLKASNDVEVRLGIVGKNKGEVYSGADIRAAFVENAVLKAAYDVTVKTGIIGSQVDCGGELKIAMPRSRVVGSTIKAARGITLYNAGARCDSSTELITGIDPEKEKEYSKIKANLETKMKEAGAVETRHEHRILTKDEIARWELLKKDIQLISKRLKKAEEQIFDYRAVIRVKETLHPRVSLAVGRHRFTTSEECHNVTVCCSPEADSLVIK